MMLSRKFSQIEEPNNDREWGFMIYGDDLADISLLSKRLEIESKLSKYSVKFNKNKYNCCLCYNTISNTIECCNTDFDLLSTLYFPSNEIAMKAVREVGYDLVKKHYFGIE